MTLTLLNLKKLDLQQTLDTLMNEGIVVIKGVESSTKGDILVRLDPRAVPVTQISLDKTREANSTYAKPYWTVHDIPFNYFVTRDVFEFTEDYRLYSPKYVVGDIVKYNYEDATGNLKEDVAIVERVFVDKEEKVNEGDKLTYYYGLSNVQYNLPESKLNKM